MKIHRLMTVLLLLLAPCFGGGAQAASADRNMPMHIEADALRHDDLRQISVFTGNVVMTKGSIIIRGDRLEVRQDPEGYQHGEVTSKDGRRSFFRQKRDTPAGTPQEYIEGEAVTISYNGRDDTVTLTGSARLRRFRGGSLGDEISGDIIHYNNVTDVFTVNGQPLPEGQGKRTGRVSATLIPQAAPPAAPPPPAPALRPSDRLGDDEAAP